MELRGGSVDARHVLGQATNLVTLDVVEAISVGEMLGNGALATACRARDDEDVVVRGNGHVARLCFAEGGRG